jgi:uncharacterized protein
VLPSLDTGALGSLPHIMELRYAILNAAIDVVHVRRPLRRPLRRPPFGLSSPTRMELPYAVLNAAIDGNARELESLLDQHPDLIETTDPHMSCTPLSWAAFRGHVDCATCLIDRGAAVDHRGSTGTTPLYGATMSSSAAAPMVKVLLERGANPCIASNEGITPLMVAAYLGKTETVRALLDHPTHTASLHLTEKNGLTALACACARGHDDVVKDLLDKGADPNVLLGQAEASALTFASFQGHIATVRTLLERGANPAIVTSGLTPLCAAKLQGHRQCVEAIEVSAHRHVPPDGCCRGSSGSESSVPSAL